MAPWIIIFKLPLIAIALLIFSCKKENKKICKMDELGLVFAGAELLSL